MLRLVNAAAVGLALLFAAAPAHAQKQRFSVLRFRAAASPLSYYNTEAARVLPHLSPSFGAYLHYARRPLQVIDPQTDDRLYDEVTYQVNAEVLATFALWNRIELGLILPIVISQDSGERDSQFPTRPGLTGGLGDLRLVPKVRLLTYGPFSAGVAVPIDLPTGERQDYRGDEGVNVEPRGILALHWPAVRLALNVGVRLRPDRAFAFSDTNEVTVVDNEFVASLAAGVHLGDAIELIADGIAVFSLVEGDEEEQSGELLFGARFYLPHGFSFDLGGGPGIGRGVGTPQFRLLGGLNWYYKRPEKQAVGDRDGDGILDDVDKCPDEPEDKDGFEDEDGCPDPDNDKDGILDADDECPNEPEDRDGFEDDDGCPDPDNDKDKILDGDDACPNDPETYNGVDDEDGCPDQATGPVQLRRGKITVPPVYFATNKDMILRRSFPVLQLVAKVLKENAWVKKVRVEGHTDSRGGDAFNLDLSNRRAGSVTRFLIEAGVEPDRLESRGYGESTPIATNNTRKGRALNRRVEFTILDPVMSRPERTPPPDQ